MGRVALDDDDRPHLEIEVLSADGPHRVAINVRSVRPPHDLLAARLVPFEHPSRRMLDRLPEGVTNLAHLRALRLDYVHGKLVRRADMAALPMRRKGPRNDLIEALGAALLRVRREGGTLYAFGEPWGPEPHLSDRAFGFEPGQGIRDVHMNQGSAPPFERENRAAADGALIIEAAGRWEAVLLAFQSQSWRTDRRTGQPLAGRPLAKRR